MAPVSVASMMVAAVCMITVQVVLFGSILNVRDVRWNELGKRTAPLSATEGSHSYKQPVVEELHISSSCHGVVEPAAETNQPAVTTPRPTPGVGDHGRSYNNDAAVISPAAPSWCLEVPTRSERPYFLVAQAYVRIYEEDLAELSRLDMLHWLTYYKYMGVEHVYIYDTWLEEGEQLQPVLQPAIDAGFVTYIDWHQAVLDHKANPVNHRKQIQMPSKQHCLEHFGPDFEWAVLFDMDEYPWMRDDQEPGFLRRYVQSTDASALMLNNHVMFGTRNYSKGDMLIEQVTRVTKEPYDRLLKPIIRRRDAESFKAIHTANLIPGKRAVTVRSSVLQKNHVWGGRFVTRGHPDWSDTIPPRLEGLLVESDMSNITKRLKQCSFNIEGNRRAYEKRLGAGVKK